MSLTETTNIYRFPFFFDKKKTIVLTRLRLCPSDDESGQKDKEVHESAVVDSDNSFLREED